MLGKVFASAREEVTGRWKKLRELHNLYCSQNITVIKSGRMDGTCNTFGRDEKFVQNFIRKA